MLGSLDLSRMQSEKENSVSNQDYDEIMNELNRFKEDNFQLKELLSTSTSTSTSQAEEKKKKETNGDDNGNGEDDDGEDDNTKGDSLSELHAKIKILETELSNLHSLDKKHRSEIEHYKLSIASLESELEISLNENTELVDKLESAEKIVKILPKNNAGFDFSDSRVGSV